MKKYDSSFNQLCEIEPHTHEMSIQCIVYRQFRNALSHTADLKPVNCIKALDTKFTHCKDINIKKSFSAIP